MSRLKATGRSWPMSSRQVLGGLGTRPGVAEQVRQTRQLPDQCFDKPWYLPTSGGTERPPPWIHSYVLGTWLEGKSVYESSCIAAKREVSGGHIPGAF